MAVYWMQVPKQKQPHKYAQLLLKKLFTKEELTTGILDPGNKRHNNTELDPQKIEKIPHIKTNRGLIEINRVN